jgi:hypothetical protein
MTDDFLAPLAQLDVRPPPPEFDRQLHERMNRSLLVQHLVDLVTGALPWALVHFAQAVVGLLRFTTTGRFDEPKRPQ